MARRLSADVVPVQELRGDELRTLSSYSVADALRFFSGVQVKDYGGVGGLKTVNVRGMGSQHVAVFYDNVELHNAQNGVVDLGRFSLSDIEAVSLYNGERSRLLQPAQNYASQSAVYLQSRRPHFANSGNFGIRAGFKAGSFSTLNPSLRLDLRLSSKVSTSLSAEYLSTSGRYRFRYATRGGYDTTATRRGSDLEAWRTEWSVFGSSGRGQWHMKTYFYRSQRGLPGAVVRGQTTRADRQGDTNFMWQGQWQRRLAPRYRLLLTAKYAYDYLHFLSDPRLDVSAMYANLRFRQQEAYVSMAHELEFSREWSVALASDFRHNHLNASGFSQFAYPSRQTWLNSVAARWHNSRLDVMASVLSSLVFDHVRSGESMPSRSELSPSLAASWWTSPQRRSRLHVLAKRVFRMPTLNDLYYTMVGNAHLQPERAWQVSAGGVFNLIDRPRHDASGFRVHALSLQADAYWNRVSHKIVAMPTSNQFRWTMLNLGKVDVKGMELKALLAANLGEWSFESRATYTLERAVDVTSHNDACYGDQIPYMPRHSGSLVASLSWRTWRLNYSFIYTGGRYDQRANIPENHLPAWYTNDVALARSFSFGQVSIELNNIFNQKYDIVKGYPMPGFHAFAKVVLYSAP